MHDVLESKIVEITLDATGKLWINIDNVCVARVDHTRITVLQIDPELAAVINSDPMGLRVMCPSPNSQSAMPTVVMGGTSAEGDLNHASS